MVSTDVKLKSHREALEREGCWCGSGGGNSKPECNEKWFRFTSDNCEGKRGESSMLTAKQEAFVQNIIQGMSQADAYRSAYPNQRMSDKTVWETASKLMANPKVVTRLKELRDQLASEKIMSAQERMEWLTEVIKSGEASYSDKLKAVDIMNKMDGEYVQKVQANVSYEDNLRKVVGEDEY